MIPVSVPIPDMVSLAAKYNMQQARDLKKEKILIVN